jgi:hypothetical protein
MGGNSGIRRHIPKLGKDRPEPSRSIQIAALQSRFSEPSGWFRLNVWRKIKGTRPSEIEVRTEIDVKLTTSRIISNHIPWWLDTQDNSVIRK